MIVLHRTTEGCRFLLVRSRLTKRPLWEFPKGGLAAGETAKVAALRELFEETGLAEADVRLLPKWVRKEDYRFNTGHGETRTVVRKKVTYYLAESMRTDVRVSVKEASEFAWLPLEEAQRRIRYPTRRAMLEAAARAASCSKLREDGSQSETSSRRREARSRSGRDSA
ncbi:MAG: NUDIX domain-containing protein [Longimicrobiales bacterium]